MKKTLITSIVFMLLSLAVSAQQDSTYIHNIYKALNFYHAQQYKQSALAFKHAFKENGGGYNDDRYTAACSWALAGNKKEAFYQLNHIANEGRFSDIDRLLIDDDLESLHSDKRWGVLVEQVKKNKQAGK